MKKIGYYLRFIGFKLKIYPRKNWEKYTLKTLFQLMEENRDIFIRLKNI